MTRLSFLALLVLVVPLSSAWAGVITLKSGINGNVYNILGQPGTAGTLGVDYALGSYLSGGNGGLGHGFKDKYAFHGGHFCGAAEADCFVSTPGAGFNATGALEATDHNWLQGTTRAIVVDLGAGNASDKAIVFNSIDHTGFSAFDNHADPQIRLWNALIEGIEFTVYGTNDATDATNAGNNAGVFGITEAGSVPGAGVGSTFEQGVLAFVFEDGWADFGNAREGDDFASVWQFSQDYRYIAVYSNNTDPFIDDGFRSFDNELDSIGRFTADLPVPEPTTLALLGLALAGLGFSAQSKSR